MKPSNKHNGLEKELDHLSNTFFGRSRTGAINANVCVICGKPATEFRDKLSKKEFGISGLCQKCQDEVFGV